MRKGWKNGWLFPEAKPLCRQCKVMSDRNGFLCSSCLKENRRAKKARPDLGGYIVTRANGSETYVDGK